MKKAFKWKEFTNFYTIPRAKDGKLINGSYNRVWKKDGHVGAVNCTMPIQVGYIKDNVLYYERLHYTQNYKLQGVKMNQIDKLMYGDIISKANHYKLAGNSIVIPVLEHIFKNKMDLPKDRPIKLFEFFAGYGSQHQALKNLGYQVEADISEWFTEGIIAYALLHHFDKYVALLDKYKDLSKEELKTKIEKLASMQTFSTDSKNPSKTNLRTYKKKLELLCAMVVIRNHGSILGVKGKQIKDNFDIFTWSFPCFTGDMLVWTGKELKPIKEIKKDDWVLTHDNTYQQVTDWKEMGKKEIWKVKASHTPIIKTTANHPFYVREMSKVWNNEKRNYERVFSKPKWVNAEELEISKHYLGSPVDNSKGIGTFNLKDTPHATQLSHAELWLFGRYLADGWYKDKSNHIVIAVGKGKLKEFKEKVGHLDVKYYEERTSVKAFVRSKRLKEIFSSYGKLYAKDKFLPLDFLELKPILLKEVVEGYLSGDGSYIKDKKTWTATSISRKIILTMGQAIAKVYKQPFKVYEVEVAPTREIEGRIVNQSKQYQLKFKEDTRKQDKSFYEDGYIWTPVKVVENTKEQEVVYDITVDKNHSFICEGAIVHNCQDLSIAGQGAGMSSTETRSGLCWEFIRILKELRELNNLPKYLLMENVPAIHNKKNIEDFKRLQEELNDLGYENEWFDLNAKDYGIPQNRNRTFMVSKYDKQLANMLMAIKWAEIEREMENE